jgi:pimeloyl-ACP methyl ester carboxylesterase
MSKQQSSGGLHVEESGTPGSPAIVFIHGAGQSSREWRGHIDRLPGFHCLAPDLPGFGRSNHLGSATKERVADLLAGLIEERVPSKRASVVGISSGGLHIHALLDRYPDRVERAFIDGSPPFGTPRIGRAIMRLYAYVSAPFIHTRPGAALWRSTHDPDDLRVASRLEFGRVVGDCFGEFAAVDAPSPALLIAGEKEGIVRSMNAAMAEVLPRGEAWYAPGLGHCWQKADPDLHIRTVEAWVGGQELPSELCREVAPSPAKVEQVRRMGPDFWYARHKGRFMRLARFYFRPFRKPLAEAYGKAAGEAIARDARRRFEVLLPDIPYIGGGGNSMTITLVKVAAKLAMYRALRAHGAAEEQAARLIHLGEMAFYQSVPMRWVMRVQGRGFLSRRGKDTWRRIAAASQERRYPEDWVYEIVEGDGQEFDFGLDCTECGAIKYLERERAPELAPYLCWSDYPQFAAMGLRLDRTETIAQGGHRCDFRLSRGQPVQVEPEFLHA